MGTLHVQAFGKLQLASERRSITAFPTRRTEELMAFLLLNPEKDHSREILVELLWPHDGEGNGRGRLSTTLWRLRTLLDRLGVGAKNCIATTRDTIIFKPCPDPQFDVRLFEEKINLAKTSKSTVERESSLLTAHRLYRGQLCEGIYSDWCLVARERLARLHLYVLGQLMAISMGNQRFEEAIEFGQAVIDEDPLREETHRAMIVCYGKLGRRADAARQFQRCANGLMKELHLLPLPETITAYRQTVTSRDLLLSKPAIEIASQSQLMEAFTEFQQAGQRLVQLLDGEGNPNNSAVEPLIHRERQLNERA